MTVPDGCDRDHSTEERTLTGARNGRAATGDVASLLGRAVVDLDVGRFGEYLAGARVLVTGAGGSIGSELCLQLARRGIRELVLVDQAEAPLIAVARMLSERLGFAGAVPVLGDIRNAAGTAALFDEHRPVVVFHAAAYKHVTLLEASPTEAVAVNVLGTQHVVDAALRVGVDRFVLFSTDKAVEPTSVLGRTKAVAEWIVASANRDSSAGRYASVRLGNVAESAGSILPVFRRQLERGGPLTVTDPAATRYLMTVDEAVKLAIVAGALAGDIGVFWLDCGPPVAIVDLARRLAAAAPCEVRIEFVGLRAGERLHERFVAEDEQVMPTACSHVWRSSARRVDPAWLDAWISVLAHHVEHASASGVRSALEEMAVTPEWAPETAPVVA